MAKWRLDGTSPRNDGSNAIDFDIWGIDDEDNPIPGRHTTVKIDADALQAALDLPTNPERNQAIKVLIGEQLDDATWSEAALDEIVIANANAVTVDGNLDTVVDTLGGYPVTFSA